MSRVSAATAGPGAPRMSRRTQQVAGSSFSVDSIVQDRFRKMVRFKRVMTTVGLLEDGCNLTDRDAVDELVYYFELMEQNTSWNTQTPTKTLWNTQMPTSNLPEQSALSTSSQLKASKGATAMHRLGGIISGDNMV